MSSDLSSLLASSKALTSHLKRQDLPNISLSLDQIEAQSRRLLPRQPGAPTDAGRANYLLAQAHIDAPALANSIAHLNTSATFLPLQPLQDTDISGYLRHAHEQNVISTIEEARRETQEEFYRVLEDRSRRDWEARKKRVFEELGGRLGGDSGALVLGSKLPHSRSSLTFSAAPSPSSQVQGKMMAYDHVVVELNAARLRGSSFPVVHAFIQAALSLNPDRTHQIIQIFHILAKITGEPPGIPPLAHAGAHILNAPPLERRHARAHLGDHASKEAVELRKQIALGARAALEEQYLDVLERTVQARPLEARLGGDPSIANRVRAFLLVRYYRGGEWQDRIELVAAQPLWAKLFYLVRTGHVSEALDEALAHRQAIEHREDSFVAHFRIWVESPDRRLPKPHRDHVQAIYNAHMLHSTSVDPFKLALYKLMGKLDSTKRTVPLVTVTAEDWLWFQLAMVDEDENTGLRGLAEVLLNYGERHFEGVPGSKGTRTSLWAAVLLSCGEFERAVATLWEHPETEIEAVHLAIALAYHGLLRAPSRAESSDITPLSLSSSLPPALSLSTLIWRYVRQFVRLDAKEALQYVYTVTLGADQPGGIGKEQLELAWDLVRRVIVLANTGPAWDELIGGFRTDGMRFTGVIEQAAPLLKLSDTRELNAEIFLPAARQAEESDRVLQGIKLNNLAGEYTTVISSLATALGTTLAAPGGGERARSLEAAAGDIIRHYERMGRAAGRGRDAVVKLLRVREALDAKADGRLDRALEVIESTDLVPLDGDVAKINRRAEEFKDLHDALQRNLQTYLPLTMDAIAGVYQKVKASNAPDASRQMTLASLRKKSRSLMVFAGMLRYRLSPDVYSYLARLDVEVAL
ncbi:nucleoporin-interacting protein NIC96 [Multifurca ochricompacta]|uniref:Nuclear pore protein n=1 Tax=Multifurca ochricompacta TaxID=376703 RepID=A0AAD4QPM4_9AGAM|nr:nucleoporin-interacting protein NIC96 [Multifurca ochricompacta]